VLGGGRAVVAARHEAVCHSAVRHAAPRRADVYYTGAALCAFAVRCAPGAYSAVATHRVADWPNAGRCAVAVCYSAVCRTGAALWTITALCVLFAALCVLCAGLAGAACRFIARRWDAAGCASAATGCCAAARRVRHLNAKRRAALETVHTLHLRHGVRVQRLGDLRSDDKDKLCFILLERLRFEQVPQDGNVGEDWYPR